MDAAEIARYEKEYQGGPEEAKDLAEYYKKFSGNLSHVTAHIPYAEEEDVPRFVGLISKMVHSKVRGPARFPGYLCRVLLGNFLMGAPSSGSTPYSQERPWFRAQAIAPV